MEAMLAERGPEVSEWNDGRLNELGKKVDDQGKRMDKGFARLDGRIDQLDQKMSDGFARIDSRLDVISGVLIRSVWTFGIGMLGFAGALLGIIAVKL
jgi:hypothetical protein